MRGFKADRGRRRGLLGLVGFVLLFGGLLLLAWIRISALELRYEISYLKARKDRLLQRNRELRLERAALTSAEELQKRAREELLLRRPEEGEVIILR